MLGKLAHYAADAVLVSAVIAGIKRSTRWMGQKQQATDDEVAKGRECYCCPNVATEKIESSDVRSYVEKYLSVGEIVVDQTAAFMSTSSYFERKR
ncbi:hypothetical protein BGX23_006501 [Mortierella sp. AD031]|nr:hypothetical protein BGX23_006501 [Mortierella sp. AD031]KAG0214604.1 hypothetical protein BGX33_001964 [Mortierella sp. NVP41]